MRDVDAVIEAATEILKEHISDKDMDADNTAIIENLQKTVHEKILRLLDATQAAIADKK